MNIYIYFPQGSQLSDVAWHGWTCTYGWPVQGIWPKALGGKSGLDGGGQDSDPYAVHRSHDEKLLVAGDQKDFTSLLNPYCTLIAL
jgi:hypothetical protein